MWRICPLARLGVVIALICMAAPVVLAQTGEDISRAGAIESDMRALASQSFQGRGLATTAGARAETFVAQRFEAAGLHKAGGSWFQIVSLLRFDIDYRRTSLEISQASQRRSFPYARSFFFTAPPPRGLRLQGAITPIGPGEIPALGRALRDPSNADAFLVLPPLSLAPMSAPVTAWTRAWLSWRLPRLAREGRANIMTLSDPEMSAPAWRELEEAYDTAGLARWRLADADESGRADVMLGPDASAWYRTLRDHDASAPIAAKLDWRGAYRRRTARNVIGLIPGSDPQFTHEIVVVTAHLDHLGRRRGITYPGAVDNAAGVASLISAAETLTHGPARPRRTVAFVATTGEEAGDLGAEWLIAHPPLPGMRIIANINIDGGAAWPFDAMVARGGELSSLGAAAQSACARSGCSVAPDPLAERAPIGGSDQFAFLVAGIPAIQVTAARSGAARAQALAWFRDRYHRPSDDMSQPLDFEAGRLFSRHVASIVNAIADADQPPQWEASALSVIAALDAR